MHQVRTVASLLVLFVVLRSGSLLNAQPVSHDTAGFHILAHRGAGMKLPENTLESFATCWRVRATPEADLQTTKDGTIVCFHDSNLKRVVSNVTGKDRNLSISALTLAEVKKLEVGSFRGEEYKGQRVPTLAKVFATMKDRPERQIYLDIKRVELDDLVVLIREYDVESQVIFASSQHKLILGWKKRLPDSKTLLWNGGSQGDIARKLSAARKRDFEGLTHFQVHARAGNADSDKPFSLSNSFLESTRDELRSRGIVFQVYLVKCADGRAYRRLLESGIDSIATDYPQVALEAARAFRRESVRPKKKIRQTKKKTAPMRPDFEALFRDVDNAREFDKLVKSKTAGGSGGGPFVSSPDKPTLLVGFEYTLSTFYGGHLTVKSVRPIYTTRDGELLGKWHGVPHGNVYRAAAKDGYVVTAIVAKHGHRLDGLRLLFMRVRKGRLNPDDTYRSKWIGGLGGGGEALYATYGDPIVSIFGRQGADIDALGFVQFDRE
jgi:glycerophosphoryl diester phosphodiesterase